MFFPPTHIGLAGSEIMSATVDLWGWRALLRLARGQTITDVMAKIPAIESGFGTHRNAIRVHPTCDDLANRCELRVLDRDPHADAIPWHGPSATSITEPIDLGPFEDAEPCRVLFLRRHAILGGATGSGESGGLNDLLASLAACRDVIIWAIDLKRGMELQPWAPCIDRLATTPAEAAALLANAVTILYARAQHLADHGRRDWDPFGRMPALVIIIDEYAELVGCQNCAAGCDLGFQAARSYSLRRPPRTGRRLICSWERSATGWSGRGGWSWSPRCGLRPL